MTISERTLAWSVSSSSPKSISSSSTTPVFLLSPMSVSNFLAIDLASFNLDPSCWRYFSVSFSSCLTRSDFASYKQCESIYQEKWNRGQRRERNLVIPYLNHSKVSLNIIDFQQINFLTLDSVNLLTMYPFLPFMELFSILIETFPTFSLHFEYIFQSFPGVQVNSKKTKNKKIRKEVINHLLLKEQSHTINLTRKKVTRLTPRRTVIAYLWTSISLKNSFCLSRILFWRSSFIFCSYISSW